MTFGNFTGQSLLTFAGRFNTGHDVAVVETHVVEGKPRKQNPIGLLVDGDVLGDHAVGMICFLTRWHVSCHQVFKGVIAKATELFPRGLLGLELIKFITVTIEHLILLPHPVSCHVVKAVLAAKQPSS